MSRSMVRCRLPGWNPTDDSPSSRLSEHLGRRRRMDQIASGVLEVWGTIRRPIARLTR